MASSGINYDKRSFMSVELTLFKKEPLLPINSDEIKPLIESISEKIIKGGHSIQETPEALLELRRILRLHLQQHQIK